MSLIIKDDEGREIWVKTGFPSGSVQFGDSTIPLVEFFAAVLYVLQNTDLEEEDPRREFVRQVRAMREGAGWNRGGKRFVMVETPTSRRS